MAGIKIVDLPNSVLPYTGTERIPITQDGQTRNGTLSSISDAFWETLRPNVLELDYIELADQSGFTIPENSLGRKGNVPYFGESPITPNKEYFFANSLVANGTPQRVLIARIPVDGSLIQPNTQIRFGFDLQFTKYGSATGYAIYFSWADDNNNGIGTGYACAAGYSDLEKLNYDGSIKLPPYENIAVTFELNESRPPILLGSAEGDAIDGNLKGKILSINGDMFLANPTYALINQDNYINIYIEDYLSHSTGNSIVVYGHAWIGGPITYVQLT
jgi:hypothetical protein